MTNNLSIDKVKVSLDVKLGGEEVINTLEENIENMLDSLVEVVGQLRNSKQSNKNIDFKKEKKKQINSFNMDNTKSKQMNENKEISKTKTQNPKELKKDSFNVTTVEDSQLKINQNQLNVEKPVIIRRKPKQLDDGLTSDEDDEIPVVYMPEVDNDDCRESTATSRVNICVPSFVVQKKNVKFFSKTMTEAKHCYDM
jgi:hypothetical protein